MGVTPLALVEDAKQALPGLPQLLDALGVSFRTVPFAEVLAKGAGGTPLLISEQQFADLSRAAAGQSRSLTDLVSGAVLVYPFSGKTGGLEALAKATGAEVSIAPISTARVRYSIAESRQSCGAFSGLQVENVRCDVDVALRVVGAAGAVQSMITAEKGSLLTLFKLDGLDLFVASSTAVFDVESEQLLNLNVSDCFSGLVPLLIFLRHSQIDRFRTAAQWATWIIDDPNLRPRYGFLDLRELGPCVRETGAAVSIAFIPWNYRRTSAEIVQQFRSAWPQLSISVHGCDHTGAEFATRTYEEALPLIQLATQRMDQFQRETSLSYDPVMIFPRGEFSSEAMRALRTSNMLAAVNTELIDCRSGSGVKGGELLRPAITSFGGFPLFMRRRAEDLKENFALDLMLGKPCLIVTHHQYFEPGFRQLRSVVEMLNKLEPGMKWTNLGAGISSTCSILQSSDSAVKVHLYSHRTQLDLRPNQIAEFSKNEMQHTSVTAFVDGVPVAVSNDRPVRFSVSRPGPATVTVDVKSGTWPADLKIRQGAKRRLKVAARRYLTEVRDNYIDRYPAVKSRLSYLRKAVGQ